jgi:hypothetical protein
LPFRTGQHFLFDVSGKQNQTSPHSTLPLSTPLPSALGVVSLSREKLRAKREGAGLSTFRRRTHCWAPIRHRRVTDEETG